MNKGKKNVKFNIAFRKWSYIFTKHSKLSFINLKLCSSSEKWPGEYKLLPVCSDIPAAGSGCWFSPPVSTFWIIVADGWFIVLLPPLWSFLCEKRNGLYAIGDALSLDLCNPHKVNSHFMWAAVKDLLCHAKTKECLSCVAYCILDMISHST